MQCEQFQSNLDSELRVWLIDQKPKNLSEVVRLADQYVAVREADRPTSKGHQSTSEGYEYKSKPFGESGRINARVGFQKTSFSHNTKPHVEQKSSITSSSAKFDRFAEERAQGLCFHCRKPGPWFNVQLSQATGKPRTGRCSSAIQWFRSHRKCVNNP